VSYLIYSESFDALPQPTKAYVYRRIREDEDRKAAAEILDATKPDFAAAR
jgi:hypothetical protein